MTGGAHANSRFEREIGEAAPGYFFNFCLRMHSAIHLHCARKQCKWIALCTGTVQFTCTVQVTFFSSVYSFCIFIFKKTSFALSYTQYFFLEKLVLNELNSLALVLNSAISRFEREIGEAAPGCFFNFCLRMHSAIHLHCSSYFFFLVCIVFVYLFLKN